MNCLAALYVTFAYCHMNLEIKVTRMHKNSKRKGVVAINLVLPIICTGVFVDWVGEVRVVFLPVCLFNLRLTLNRRPGSHSLKVGSVTAGETAVSWTGFR